VDARRLGAPEERADVLRILQGIEDEDERGLASFDGAGEDVVDPGIDPWLDREGDPLVAVEPGQGGQCPALDLDDRDPKAGCVEDEPLERLAALRNDEQATCGSSSDERLLDGSTSRDELFVLAEEIRRRDGRSERGGRARARLPLAVRSWPVEVGSVEAGSVAAGWPEARSIGSLSILIGTIEASAICRWAGGAGPLAEPALTRAGRARAGRATAEWRSRPAGAIAGRSVAWRAVALLPPGSRRRTGVHWRIPVRLIAPRSEVTRTGRSRSV
jgi:hypothetical protein